MLSDKTNSVRKTPNGQNYYGGTINYREMKGRQFISHLNVWINVEKAKLIPYEILMYRETPRSV